jgi:hypothetical protein
MESPDIPYKLNQGTKYKKIGNFLYCEVKIRSRTKSNNWKIMFVNCSMYTVNFKCTRASIRVCVCVCVEN